MPTAAELAAWAIARKDAGGGAVGGNAAASDIRAGKTAYVNGALVTGTFIDWVRDYSYNVQNLFRYAELPESVVIVLPLAIYCSTVFYNTQGMKHLDITLGDVTGVNGFFMNNNVIETVIFRNDMSHVVDYGGMFAGCSALTEITNPLDGSAAVGSWNYGDTFAGCAALVTSLWVPSTIKQNVSYADSPLLSNASLLSLANGLNESTADKTLTLHATSKAITDALMVDNESGMAVAGNAMTLTAFMESVKGWTVT